MLKRSTFHVGIATVALAVSLAATPVFAQAQQTPASADLSAAQADEGDNDIVVTGSRIRRDPPYRGPCRRQVRRRAPGAADYRAVQPFSPSAEYFAGIERAA